MNKTLSIRIHGAFVAIATLVITQACSTTSPHVDERLDAQSGATLMTAAVPLTFARTDARYSRSGRDYLYLGPVSLNRQGLREYYLWVGIASTIDRGYLAPARPAPTLLHVIVDDELMEFELGAWEALVGTRSGSPEYPTRVSVQSQLVARVTLDQIERLARSAIRSIYVADERGQQTFTDWAAGDWREFLRREGALRVASERP
jgi:hypothetical protein